MTVQEFVAQLDGVKLTGRGVMARCPAHDDRHPSLSVREGERGLLVKCWSGCTIAEIVAALGLSVRDLFFDSCPDRTTLDARRQTREYEQTKRREASHREGLKLDVLRESEHLIRTARGLDIITWSTNQLDAALNRVADAYETLERDHDYSV